uniref:Uncharacterized protein n=1 Tax=Romanomermis culicivorax TaxID=13658 RepID=A0A915JRT8_ROMCU
MISSIVASSSRSSSMTILASSSIVTASTGSQESSTHGYSTATNLPLYPACLATLTTSRSSVMYSSSRAVGTYNISQSPTPVSSMPTVTYMTSQQDYNF